MPQSCAVPYCSERKGGHRFPKDNGLLKLWLKVIRRSNFVPSKHSRVCKNHFNPDDYELPKESYAAKPIPRLKKEVVPTRFLWNHESEERMKIKRKKDVERSIQLQKIARHEDKLKEYFIEINEVIDIEHSKEHISVQYDVNKLIESKTNKDDVSGHKRNGRSTITANIFQIENLKDEPDIMQFYTGFDNYKHFMFVFNLFGDEVNNLKYSRSLQPARGEHELTPCNQFYLTLIKLRRNMCYTELSFHFKISKTSVNNYFITWINYLYCKFKNLQVWAPKKIIDQNMLFQRQTCIVVIESTEKILQLPQNPVLQHIPLDYKLAIAISSSGCITFVSDAYDGSISDKELFEKCGIINLLLTGNAILCDHHQSSKRINVEHIKGLGKIYKIFNNKLEYNMVSGGQIIFVCFMLINLRENIN